MGLGLAVGTNYFFNSTLLNCNKSSNQEKEKFDYMVYGGIGDKLTDEDINQSNLKEMGKQELFEKLRFSSARIQSRIQKKSAVEFVPSEEEVKRDDLKNIGLTSFEISDTMSQLVVASLVKSSDGDDPIVQVSYGRGDARKIYHVHVNEVDTTNASDLEMFALLSYEGYKQKTSPNAINNFSAYKTMKVGAGYGMSSISEASFVNEKINVNELLQQVYDSLKDGKTSEEKKNAEICDYLINLLKEHSYEVGK